MVHWYLLLVLYYVVSISEPPSYDYGDAPDPSYPVLLASDGVRNLVRGEGVLPCGQVSGSGRTLAHMPSEYL